jgi:hypothetical protein
VSKSSYKALQKASLAFRDDMERIAHTHRVVGEAWRDESLAVCYGFLMLAESYEVLIRAMDRWRDGLDK